MCHNHKNSNTNQIVFTCIVSKIKNMNRVLLLLFPLIFVFANCIKTEREEPDNDSDTSHLEYFGFAITDCGLINPLDSIDNFVNLVDMCLYDFENIRTRINNNLSDDNLVIIHLHDLFLDYIYDSSSPTGIRYKLLPDYKNRFELWSSNNQDIPINMIAAFTIADEPAWNKMEMEDLAKIAKLVKDAFPTIPIMIIESSEGIDSLTITDDIDWIGFDRYGTINPDSDNEYLSAMNKLKGKIQNTNQRIVVVMETQWLPYYTDLGFNQSILISMAQSYFDYAKRDDKVIALISYLLPSDFDEIGQKGFLDLDKNVQDEIKRIGCKIVNQ